ncbi:unnamed protein product, partial [Vitis vinifera]
MFLLSIFARFSQFLRLPLSPPCPSSTLYRQISFLVNDISWCWLLFHFLGPSGNTRRRKIKGGKDKNDVIKGWEDGLY